MKILPGVIELDGKTYSLLTDMADGRNYRFMPGAKVQEADWRLLSTYFVVSLQVTEKARGLLAGFTFHKGNHDSPKSQQVGPAELVDELAQAQVIPRWSPPNCGHQDSDIGEAMAIEPDGVLLYQHQRHLTICTIAGRQVIIFRGNAQSSCAAVGLRSRLPARSQLRIGTTSV